MGLWARIIETSPYRELYSVRNAFKRMYWYYAFVHTRVVDVELWPSSNVHTVYECYAHACSVHCGSLLVQY